jgi:alpha-galactosidase
MEKNGFSQNDLAPSAGPGHWNDPDMLEVGNGKMSTDEYKTHMSLWSLLASPLIAGNDLRSMTPTTKAILMNPEVIAIDQDPLGHQATRLYQHGAQDVWSKPLTGGALAVGVFNRSNSPMTITLRAADLNLGPNPTTRDLWTHTPIVFQNGVYTTTIPTHGVLLLRLKNTP